MHDAVSNTLLQHLLYLSYSYILLLKQQHVAAIFSFRNVFPLDCLAYYKKPNEEKKSSLGQETIDKFR